MPPDVGETKRDPFSLKYWQAVEAFGLNAVEGTLSKTEVASRHPDLVHKLSVSDEQTKREITLPREVVLDIVAHPECKDDYYADPDGRRLYSVERRWSDRSGPQARGTCSSTSKRPWRNTARTAYFWHPTGESDTRVKGSRAFGGPPHHPRQTAGSEQKPLLQESDSP